MKIIIDHGMYGTRMEFTSLEEAAAAIQSCGDDFQETQLSLGAYDPETRQFEVLDERGQVVGLAIEEGEMSSGKMIAEHGDQVAIEIDGRAATLIAGDPDPHWAEPGDVFRDATTEKIFIIAARGGGWIEITDDELAAAAWNAAVGGGDTLEAIAEACAPASEEGTLGLRWAETPIGVLVDSGAGWELARIVDLPNLQGIIEHWRDESIDEWSGEVLSAWEIISRTVRLANNREIAK